VAVAIVNPAEAGIHNPFRCGSICNDARMDPRLRGDDGLDVAMARVLSRCSGAVRACSDFAQHERAVGNAS